ncbi:MAG: type II secretion system F family protein [Anaerolineae bacterium]
MVTSLMWAGLLGGGIFLLFYGLAQIFGKQTTVTDRLAEYGQRPRSLEELEMSLPFSERVLAPIIRGSSQFIQRFAPQQNTEKLKRQLELAGNPNGWTPADFLGVRGLAAVVVGMLTTTLMWVLHNPFPMLLLGLGGGGLVGFMFPNLWMSQKIGQRKHAIQRALPDALDLLTISVEAGLAFDSAMAKVAEKWDNELSRAFGRVIAEVRVGKLRREALRDMVDRTDVPDVGTFIAAVIQADQLGVSMSKVLRIQSEQMRVKRRQRAEESANSAPVKMMIPLAFLIFPSIFIIIMGPTAITFMNGGLLPK